MIQHGSGEHARAAFSLQAQLLTASSSLALGLAQQLAPPTAQATWPPDTQYATAYMQMLLRCALFHQIECLHRTMTGFFHPVPGAIGFDPAGADPPAATAICKAALLEMCASQPFMLPVSLRCHFQNEPYKCNTSSDVFLLLAWVRWMLPAARLLQASMRAAAPCLAPGTILDAQAASEGALTYMLFNHVWNLPCTLAVCLDSCLGRARGSDAPTAADCVQDSSRAMLRGLELEPTIAIADRLSHTIPKTAQWLKSIMQHVHHASVPPAASTEQQGAVSDPGASGGGSAGGDRAISNSTAASSQAAATAPTTFVERLSAIAASPLLDALLGWVENECGRLVGELAHVCGVAVPGWCLRAKQGVGGVAMWHGRWNHACAELGVQA